MDRIVSKTDFEVADDEKSITVNLVRPATYTINAVVVLKGNEEPIAVESSYQFATDPNSQPVTIPPSGATGSVATPDALPVPGPPQVGGVPAAAGPPAGPSTPPAGPGTPPAGPGTPPAPAAPGVQAAAPTSPALNLSDLNVIGGLINSLAVDDLNRCKTAKMIFDQVDALRKDLDSVKSLTVADAALLLKSKTDSVIVAAFPVAQTPRVQALNADNVLAWKSIRDQVLNAAVNQSGGDLATFRKILSDQVVAGLKHYVDGCAADNTKPAPALSGLSDSAVNALANQLGGGSTSDSQCTKCRRRCRCSRLLFR